MKDQPNSFLKMLSLLLLLLFTSKEQSKHAGSETEKSVGWMMAEAEVKSIFIYPIKSCRGISVSEAPISSTGQYYLPACL